MKGTGQVTSTAITRDKKLYHKNPQGLKNNKILIFCVTCCKKPPKKAQGLKDNQTPNNNNNK